MTRLPLIEINHIPGKPWCGSRHVSNEKVAEAIIRQTYYIPTSELPLLQGREYPGWKPFERDRRSKL